MIKGNRGEWSEFYAFLKLLADGKLFAADEKLRIIKDIFYPILRVIREEAQIGKRFYDISEQGNCVKIKDEGGQEIAVVEIKKIKSKLKKIFTRIKNSSDTTFGIEFADKIMRELRCSQIKAVSRKKADIVLVVHDLKTNMKPEIGFSIKSMVGSPSTLLNSSAATNFVFRIEGVSDEKIEAINSIGGNSKVRDRLKAIEKAGGEMIFECVQSKIFENNLKKIDVILPEITGELLRVYYGGRGQTLPELTEYLGQHKKEIRSFELETGDYDFKLKNLLSDVALGMVPNTEWDGLLKAGGGYIIVREDGEIVCYHLYNLDEFRSYLFANTGLDTPSTSRHGFGDIYKKDGKKYIKLNLQIRFIK